MWDIPGMWNVGYPKSGLGYSLLHSWDCEEGGYPRKLRIHAVGSRCSSVGSQTYFKCRRSWDQLILKYYLRFIVKEHR